MDRVVGVEDNIIIRRHLGMGPIPGVLGKKPWLFILLFLGLNSLCIHTSLFATPIHSFSDPSYEGKLQRDIAGYIAPNGQNSEVRPQRLIAKPFVGNLNPQLGLKSKHTAACVNMVCGNGAMNSLAWNAKVAGAWVSRYSNLGQLESCVSATPDGTKNLIIGAHGAPDVVGPMNKSNYKRVARAVKDKGITHVAFASCSAGHNADKPNYGSLPKLFAAVSGADVTAYSTTVYSGPSQFGAKNGNTVAYTWTSGKSGRDPDHVGVLEGDGSPNRNGRPYPYRNFGNGPRNWGHNPDEYAIASQGGGEKGGSSRGGLGNGGSSGGEGSVRSPAALNYPKMPSPKPIPSMKYPSFSSAVSQPFSGLNGNSISPQTGNGGVGFYPSLDYGFNSMRGITDALIKQIGRFSFSRNVPLVPMPSVSIRPLRQRLGGGGLNVPISSFGSSPMGSISLGANFRFKQLNSRFLRR